MYKPWKERLPAMKCVRVRKTLPIWPTSSPESLRPNPDEWLPSYYHAHCLIVSSFIEQDRTKKEEYIESARPALERVMEMAKNDSEAHVLQAMFYSAELVVDPATRGQKYGMLSGQSVQVALSIDPDNPRAKYMDIQNGMGTAQFFGQDIAPYCERAKKGTRKFR